MKYLLRNFGPQLKSRVDMYALINDIFYTGYNRQVIECLGEISKICRGEFKRAAQVKLLNSCSIILTQKRDTFPLNLEDQFMMSSNAEAAAFVDSRATGRGRANSDEESKNEQTMQFGGHQETEGQGSETTREGKNQRSNLKAFYNAVLNKENQKFLHELVKQSNLVTTQDKESTQNATTERTTMVTLALRTLQMFDFDSLEMCIVYFIENSVLNYLDDENPMVRKEAM